ncbi:MAG: [dimethylamine--corrinoid protein] Co-methyltransferase [Actinobacteria bacterium]|nr:[dimethylamine--corrinoid protein] Co-methyltransferase [Actinomycetota bacterium]
MDVPTRMGDGSLVRMSRADIEAEVRAGVEAAVKRAKVPPLGDDEMDHLVDVFASAARFSAVDIGDEVILSSDGVGSQDVGSRINDLQTFEQTVCTDTVELYHHDYSFKPIKPVLPFEQETMRQAQFLLTVPCQYGAMPDLGRYTTPDGPVPNWSQLLPLGKIDEARAAQEEAVELAVDDIVYVADGMYEAGADGINLDTAGAAGDADFLAALKAIERIRAKYPEWGIQIGMASEFVLGMHGELEYEGVRLAGLWPADQMRLAAQAGASVFGPAINVNTGKTVAWNVARTCAIVKPCTDAAQIPIHLNGGMGVGGVPMHALPPVDAVSRASRACVDILKLDGL